MILLLLPFLISLMIGMCALYLLFPKNSRPPLMLSLILSWGIGFAISSLLSFSSFIIFNQFNRTYIVAIQLMVMLALGIVSFLSYRRTKSPFLDLQSLSKSDIYCTLGLIILSIPLWFQIFFYAFGGWDAWATWNFKAKFMFLGGTHWQNMFDHRLWRSSPHYPLFLPLTNLWGWIFQQEPVYQGPCLTAYLFTMLTVGTLYFGLKKLTSSSWSILSAIALLTMPFFNKLALSQYCDNVVAFYLLAGSFCLIASSRYQEPRYAALFGFFCGIMTFTKNEGMLSAQIMIALSVVYVLWANPPQDKKKTLICIFSGFFVGLIPSIFFYTLYAPHNITFINGLTWSIKPITLNRVKTLIVFYSMEVGSPIWAICAAFIPSLKMTEFACKWGGFWVILGVALLMQFKEAFRREYLIFPVFLVLFMTVITAYYIVNTYFQIDWWLQVSLNRIISALLPVVIFWTFLAFWPKKNP